MGQEPPPSIRNFFDQLAAWLAPGPQSRGLRTRLAQFFALLGAAFAIVELLLSTLDLADRTVGRLRAVAPYLIPAILAAGLLGAIYLLVTAASPAQRRRAAVTMVLVVAAGLAWGGWTAYQRLRPPKAIVVMVADFQGQHATKGVDWGRRIFERVNAQVKQLRLGERVEVQRVFEAYGSPEQARERGQANKAAIVLWGWYDDEGVSPRFELLRKAETFDESLPAPPAELTDFELYLRSGPQEMAYIVAVALGLIRYADGDYATAESLFTSALSSAPEQAALLGLHVPYFYRANARFLGSRSSTRPMGEIASDLQAALARQPDFWQAHWNLALVYSDYCTPTLTLDAALAEATRVEELRPSDPAAHWLMGQVRARRGEWPEAQAAHARATELDPNYVDAYEGLGRALDEMGRTEEARAAYDRALALREGAPDQKPDDSVMAQDRLGYAYLNAGQYDRAIAAISEAIRRDPDNADYHRHLGNAYYWQGREAGDGPNPQLAQAIAEYEAARALAPDDSLLLTVLGGAYSEAGRQEDALRAYEDAVKAAPCDDDALMLLAGQLDRLGRSAEAEAAFTRLVALNPRQSLGWHYLATAAFLREDYAASAEAYRRASDIAPDDPTVLYGLASSLYSLEDYAGAEAAYRRARSLAPEDAAVWAGWGDSLAKLGRAAPAIEAYEKAVALDPGKASLWMSLGMLYEREGRAEDALRAYEQAAALQGDDPLLHAARGRILQGLGRYAEAASAYETALSGDAGNVSYWESLSLTYAALDRTEDAMRAADEVLRRNPQSAIGHLVRGSVLEGRGQRDEARAEYERVVALAQPGAGPRQLAEAGLARLQAAGP